MKHLRYLLLFLSTLAGAQVYSIPPDPITASGGTVKIPNFYGAMNVTFEEVPSGSPATASITVQGCMRGNTCDAAADTNASTSASIRSITPTAKVYSYFLVTATWSGGTNVSVQVNPVLTTARGGGGGSGLTITTVAGLAASPATGTTAVVTNASSNTDCTVGGGATIILCRYGGASWGSFPAGSATAGGSTTQLQYNNAGAEGGISQFTTNGTTTITGSATSVLDLHAAGVGGLLLPGALATGIVKTTTSTGVISILTAPVGALVGTTDTQALTNKDLTGAGNTFPTFNQNTSGTAASFTGSLAGDVTGTQGATTVGKINGISLGGLATGILKNTTTTGVPSIAVAGDFPTLNQNTSGTAANLTGCTPSLAGDVCIWNGTAWTRLAGNASGTNWLQETSSGVPSWTTPAGSGTVTTFSAGTLSPLFTTSVATATTTPALSFSLSTAAAHTYFGNTTGSTAAPAFTAIGTADIPAISLTAAGNGGVAANQGTTTTVLHGNVAGQPSFGSVSISTDVSGLGTGVGTFLGTPSSANLAAALTDEIGSGKATFATALTGTDANLLTSGTVTGAGNTLCVDAQGGATTSGCTSSGFANPMTTLGDIIYENATPAAARLAGPTATNGVAQVLTSIPASGAATAPVWAPSGVPTNAQVGTTYTITAIDRASYVTFSNASSIAVTLPQAGSTGFASNFVFVGCDIGAGTATITPTTSTISYSTGSGYTSAASSLALTTGQCAWIYSDNTNYFAILRDSVTGPASSTTTDLASFNGAAGNILQDSGIASANVVTAASNYTSGDLVQAAGANKTTSDSAIATANVVTAASNFTNGQLVQAAGANKTLTSATGHGLALPLLCSDTSASGTAQVCNTTPTFTPVAGDCVIYTTTTANTGAGLTLNVDSLGAKSVAKWLGTTTLVANDVLANKEDLTCYDGTNWELHTIGNAPGGTGTVTTFSAGTLSPLFTTSVANPTSTPALSFSLTNAGAGTVFGNNTGAAAAPAYTSTPVLGLAGTTVGTLGFANATSGSVTLSPVTGALGANTISLPAASGTAAISATSPITESAIGAIGCATCVTSAASLTSNAVIIGGGSQASSTISTDSTTTHSLFATAGAPAFRAIANSDLPGTGSVTISPQSQTCTLGSSCIIPLSAINPQTTTYQVLAADFSAYKTITVASGTFTITLVASGAQPAAGQYINILNYGSGSVTVARSGQNINGAAGNLTLVAGTATTPTSATVWSDATNYFAAIDTGTTGTVTSVATSGPITGGTITGSGTIACATCVTSAASLTNNALVIGGGAQASSTISASTTTTQALFATAGAPAFRGLANTDLPAITLDKSSTGLANPTADATFTEPIGSTTGTTLNGTAPASVATATGTNGSSILVVAAPVGGADSNATGTAGVGGSPAITAGAGGAGTGTNTVGGAGGSVTLTAGNGGASLGTGVNANGGNIVALPGTAGSGGSGTAGKTGAFQVGSSAPAPIPGTAGGMIAVEGTAFTGISGDDGWYPNATNHCFDLVNGTTDVGCAVAVGQANTYGNFLQDFSGGTIRVPTLVAGVTNIAGTFQAGADATTTGASAAFTGRGEDVTGGSTASLAGGAATLRGGDNASTGNSNAGGAATVRGGDATGGTGTTDTAGNSTVRGGNCTSTTGSCTPGTASVTSGGFTAAFTNGAASDETIAAGLGTGNAAVSHVLIKSPALSQTSGTTAQTQVTRYVTHVKAGSTTSATATTLFNVALANNQTAGFLITVHVETTQATPQNCSTTETFVASVQDTAGTVTSQTTAGSIGTICSTGTLTLAGAFSAAAPSVFSITPTWATIVPTAVTITIQIQNLSQQDIALL